MTVSDRDGIWPRLMEGVLTIQKGGRGYPPSLECVPDPPARLRVRGLIGSHRRVAVVGSRATDEYGADVAAEIAAGLARAGVSVVSGGAEGVDAAAHRAAVDAGGHTVAVLGCGIDVAYPRANGPLFERIVASGGALVTEQDDGTPPLPRHFPARNRIVAGLAEAVVVVRARERSGALITAHWGRRLGLPVLAVPGDVHSELSAGAHALLRAGARPATSAADVLDLLGIAHAPLAVPVQLDLAPELGALWRALGRRPLHADEVARGAGLPPAAALAGLLTLELEGLCEQRPGHYFLRRA